MDPRNPLGRLDWLSRRPQVRRLALRFEGRTPGDVVRGVEVELRDGRSRAFEMGLGTSWIDLLDRVSEFLESERSRRAGRKR